MSGHRVGVGFLAGRKLLRFYAKLGQSKLLHFYGRDRIKLLVLRMPSFFSGALRAHTSTTLQLTHNHSFERYCSSPLFETLTFEGVYTADAKS